MGDNIAKIRKFVKRKVLKIRKFFWPYYPIEKKPEIARNWRAGGIMLRNLVVSVTLASLLVGCGPAMRAEQERLEKEAEAQANIERIECARRFPANVPRTRLGYARCLAVVDTKYVRPTTTPDAFDVIVAKRTALAAQVDAGVISQEEADLQFAQTKSQVIGDLERRGLARRSVAAQEAANSVMCTRIGNSVACY